MQAAESHRAEFPSPPKPSGKKYVPPHMRSGADPKARPRTPPVFPHPSFGGQEPKKVSRPHSPQPDINDLRDKYYASQGLQAGQKGDGGKSILPYQGHPSTGQKVQQGRVVDNYKQMRRQNEGMPETTVNGNGWRSPHSSPLREDLPSSPSTTYANALVNTGFHQAPSQAMIHVGGNCQFSRMVSNGGMLPVMIQGNQVVVPMFQQFAGFDLNTFNEASNGTGRGWTSAVSMPSAYATNGYGSSGAFLIGNQAGNVYEGQAESGKGYLADNLSTSIQYYYPSAPGQMASNMLADHMPSNIPSGQLPNNMPAGQMKSNMPAGQMLSNVPTGQMISNIPTGQMISNIPTGQMPSNKPAKQMPRNIPNGQMPSNKPAKQMPRNIPTGQMPSNMPNGQMPSNIPNGQMPKNGLNGQIPNNLQAGQISNNMPAGQMKNNIPSGQMKNTIPTGHMPGKVPSGQMKNNIPNGQMKNNIPTGQVPSNMPTGQVPSNKPTGQMPSNVPAGQVPSNKPTGQMPSNIPAGQVPSNKPTGQMPINVPAGQVPSNKPTGQMPSNVPAGQVPSNFPAGQVPSNKPTGQMPSNVPAGQVPSNLTSSASFQNNITAGFKINKAVPEQQPANLSLSAQLSGPSSHSLPKSYQTGFMERQRQNQISPPDTPTQSMSNLSDEVSAPCAPTSRKGRRLMNMAMKKTEPETTSPPISPAAYHQSGDPALGQAQKYVPPPARTQRTSHLREASDESMGLVAPVRRNRLVNQSLPAKGGNLGMFDTGKASSAIMEARAAEKVRIDEEAAKFAEERAREEERKEKERKEKERREEERREEARREAERKEEERKEEERKEEERKEEERKEEERKEEERKEKERKEEERKEDERKEEERKEEERKEEERKEEERKEEERKEEERKEEERKEERKEEERREEARREREEERSREAAGLEEERENGERLKEARLRDEVKEARMLEEGREKRKRDKKAQKEMIKSGIGLYSKVELIAYRISVGDEVGECLVNGGLPKSAVDIWSGVDKIKKEKICQPIRERIILSDKWRTKQQEEKGNENEAIIRRMKGILNKLTATKFDKLYADLLESGMKTSAHIECLMKEVFDKAVTQHHFIPLYTKLCEKLNAWCQALQSTTDFRRILLTQCQVSFERNLRPPLGLLDADVNDDQALEKEIKYKQAMLGNIKFVGELLSVKLLASRVLIQCGNELLHNQNTRDRCNFIALECLGTLLQVTGKIFDNPGWKYYPALLDIYQSVNTISNDGEIPARIRFMFRNIADSRAKNWGII